jgi:hypothetical protein
VLYFEYEMCLIGWCWQVVESLGIGTICGADGSFRRWDLAGGSGSTREQPL